MSKTCEEKTRLADVYRDATERFSHSVNELREKIGKSSKEEYERLRRTSKEWRVHSEQARLANSLWPLTSVKPESEVQSALD